MDDADAIYVTEPAKGRIAVYDSRGKFKRYLGDRDGEGLFAHPASIAIDRVGRHIYVADSLSHLIFKLDMDGNVVARFGNRRGGRGPGQFRSPTAIAVNHQELVVLDLGNSRLQVLDLAGHYLREFALPVRFPSEWADATVALDDQGHIFMSNPAVGTVQLLDRNGALIHSFWGKGGQPESFGMPTGVWVDAQRHLYVVDTRRHRVQVFRVRETRADTIPR
ncbi:MAG: hypothetical protein ACE14L_13270 [Terriglobales bacterium]